MMIGRKFNISHIRLHSAAEAPEKNSENPPICQSNAGIAGQRMIVVNAFDSKFDNNETNWQRQNISDALEIELSVSALRRIT